MSKTVQTSAPNVQTDVTLRKAEAIHSLNNTLQVIVALRKALDDKDHARSQIAQYSSCEPELAQINAWLLGQAQGGLDAIEQRIAEAVRLLT